MKVKNRFLEFRFHPPPLPTLTVNAQPFTDGRFPEVRASSSPLLLLCRLNVAIKTIYMMLLYGKCRKKKGRADSRCKL